MGKKGLSADEKRQKVLELLQQSKTCWLLKDIEKAAAKKGVVSQSVKEVVQSLVDDDMVHSDKIGTSNWFWSFPAEASDKLKNKEERTQKEVEDLTSRLEDLQKRIDKAKEENPKTESWEEAERKNKEAKEAHKELKEELRRYEGADPEEFESLRKVAKEAKEAANRWTDNIFLIKEYCDRLLSDKSQSESFFSSQGVDISALEFVE